MANYNPEDLIVQPKSFARTESKPLDSTEIWYSLDEALSYCKNGNIYDGQTVKVKLDDGKMHTYIVQYADNDYKLEEQTHFHENKEILDTYDKDQFTLLETARSEAQTLVGSKLDSKIETENAGKLLTVDEEGNIIPEDLGKSRLEYIKPISYMKGVHAKSEAGHLLNLNPDVDYNNLCFYNDDLSISHTLFIYYNKKFVGSFEFNPSYLSTVLNIKTRKKFFITFINGLLTFEYDDEGNIIQDSKLLSTFAHKPDVLMKTNKTAYTPTDDYNPATKKYVDDNINGKVNIAQGIENAGKVLQVEEDGNIVPKNFSVPTMLSELQEDGTHRTVTDAEKENWNAKSNFSGNYNDLENKPAIPTVPDALPNPHALTFSGVITAEYDGSGAVMVTIPDAQIERIEKLGTDTVVELQPNKLYIFPEMESLTYTLAHAADAGVANEYHFVFKSGATPTEVIHPQGVSVGNFTVDANKIYEVSVMENLLTSQNWEVAV